MQGERQWFLPCDQGYRQQASCGRAPGLEIRRRRRVWRARLPLHRALQIFYRLLRAAEYFVVQGDLQHAGII
jgi:hypothetical protein